MKKLAVILLVFVVSSCASDEEYELVKYFVEQDFSGQRLGGDATGLMHVVAWEDEPGWDDVMMVSSFEVTKGIGRIKVEFVTHGRCPYGEFTEPKIEVHTFETVESDGKLLIKSPLYAPRISREIACGRFPQCCG